MKKLTIGALVGAQLLTAAQPALAADLVANGDQRIGAFGGLRVRLPLGGEARDRQLRAGFTLAPTLRDRNAGGEARLRIGEGVEFGLRGREPMRLMIGGQDVRRLGAQETERRGGLPTGVWIAGGIVLVTVVGVAAIALVLEDAADEPS